MSKTQQFIDTAKRATLQNYRPAPVVLTEGQGVRVRDVDGREYLDLAGGLAVTSVGHAHPKLAQAIADYAATANDRAQNIGARRLHTVMEAVLDELSFTASELLDKRVVIDAADVHRSLAPILADADLAKFIL